MFNNKLMVNFWQFLSVSMLDAVKREQSCRINRTLLNYMIIRNCHKKYNLCRNDAAASPFGKGCHEVAGYVSNNHTLLNPKCFSINGSVEKS